MPRADDCRWLIVTVRISFLIGLFYLAPAAATAGIAYGNPDKVQILELLESGQFEALDTLLTGYQSAYESGRAPEKTIVRAFYAFRNTDPNLEAPLDRWAAAFPKSFAPYLARALYTEYRGWAWQTVETRPEAVGRYFAVAARDYRSALRLNPRLGLAYGRLMMIGLATGRAALRQQAYAQGLAADPRSFYLRALRMHSLRPEWSGSREKMQAFADAVIGERPGAPIARYVEAYITFHTAEALSEEDRRRAAVHYDRAVEIGEYGQFFFERGRNLYALGDTAGALASLNRALDVNPQVAVFLGERAWVLRQLGRSQEALADLDLAVRLDARDPEHLRHRARLLTQRKQYDKALEDLDNALVYGSDNIDVWRNRLEIHRTHARNAKAALDDAWQLFKLQPGDPGTWTALIATLWELLMDSLFG